MPEKAHGFALREVNAARGRLQLAPDDFQERGFSRAVDADDAEALSFPQGKGESLQNIRAAEAETYAVEGKTDHDAKTAAKRRGIPF